MDVLITLTCVSGHLAAHVIKRDIRFALEFVKKVPVGLPVSHYVQHWLFVFFLFNIGNERLFAFLNDIEVHEEQFYKSPYLVSRIVYLPHPGDH